jgi:TonB family protein
MKIYPILCVLVLNTLFLFAQPASDAPFIEGSWEISKVEDLNNGGRPSYDSKYLRQRIHFLSDHLLILESRHGYYSTTYRQKADTLYYGTQALPISSAPPEGIQLTYTDSMQNSQYRLTLRPVNAFPQELAATHAEALQQETVGAFSVKGLYYRFDEQYKRYHYVWMLPYGKIINFFGKKKPEETLPRLHKHYVNPIYAELTHDQKNSSSTAITHTKYTNKRKIKGEQILTYTHNEYVATADSLNVHHVVFDVEGDTLSNNYQAFSFYPFESTGYWTYRRSNDTAPGYTFYEELLLPQYKKVEEIFKVVEEMPRFPGCENLPRAERKKCADKEMLEFIYKNLNYPAEARANNIQGTLVVQFVIEKDGQINDINVVRDIGGQCGEEAERVIRLMNEMGKRWIPGKQRGRPVRVQLNLPVKFRI